MKLQSFLGGLTFCKRNLNCLASMDCGTKRNCGATKQCFRRVRGIARSLLGMSADERKRREEQLLGRLTRLGILDKKAALDDVLDLTLENLLERRLQTIVFRKGLAKSMHQARQLIAHGHVGIRARRASSPSYLVMRDEEAKITYAPSSPLSNSGHPLRESLAGAAEMVPQPKGEREEET